MSLSYAEKKKIRRVAVYIKYLWSLLTVIAVLIACMIPSFRLSNDDTVRETQSVFGLAGSAWKSSAATVKNEAAEDYDIALAKDLRTGIAVMWAFIAVMTVFSAVLAAFSLYAWRFPGTSREANLARLHMSAVFPGRWLQFVLYFLPLIPGCLPYYVINRFTAYYRVSKVTSTTAEYYDYAVVNTGLSPLVLAAVLAVVGIFLFVLGMEWEGILQMDMFRRFDKKPEDRESRD